MFEIRYTEAFSDWVERLRDRKGRAKILVRIDRLRLGMFGDCKSVGGGVAELRIDYGPGYRLYYTKRGNQLVILLSGGDKSSQNKDIRKALSMLKNLEV